MKLTGKQKEKIQFFADAVRFSCVLEVCTDKPGNVSPSHNFSDTYFENFIFGSVFLGDAVEFCARSGFSGKPEIGKSIYRAVKSLSFFNKKNTHLGIIMLFMPLAAAYGVCVRENDFHINFLRKNLKKIIVNTTVKDSFYLQDAFMIASPGGLGEEKKFDINDKNFKEKILKNNMVFFKLMKISSARDLIASELSNGMHITFNIGYPKFLSFYKEENLRESVLKTYLAILSEFPDTLIARKKGIETAKQVSAYAKDVVSGRKDISVLKKFLHENSLNPGSIADITTASVLLGILNKFGFIL